MSCLLVLPDGKQVAAFQLLSGVGFGRVGAALSVETATPVPHQRWGRARRHHHQLLPRPSQNRTCAFHASGSTPTLSHECRVQNSSYSCNARESGLHRCSATVCGRCPRRALRWLRVLSSSRVTRLHRYYDAIRLPRRHLPLSPLQLVGHTRHLRVKRAAGISQVAATTFCKARSDLRPRVSSTCSP